MTDHVILTLRRRPFAIDALIAAVLTAVAGLLGCLMVTVGFWLADDHGVASDATALRTSLQLWLLVHHVTINAGTLALSIPPLLLTAAIGYLGYRRMLAAARDRDSLEGSQLVAGLVMFVVVYAAVGGAVAAVASSGRIAPSVGQAVLACALVALVMGAAGVARAIGSGLDTIPLAVRVGWSGAWLAVGMLIIGGLVLVIGSLVAHRAVVGDIQSSVTASGDGVAGLWAICGSLLPNAAIWAAAFALGPGFSVGAGTSVTPLGTDAGPLPALPILGAIPGAADQPVIVLLVCALPLAAGLIVGVRNWRRTRTIGLALTQTAVSALFAAVLLGVLAALASGAIGPGRLAFVGPNAAMVGLAAFGELLVAGAIGVSLGWLLRARDIDEFGDGDDDAGDGLGDDSLVVKLPGQLDPRQALRGSLH